MAAFGSRYGQLISRYSVHNTRMTRFVAICVLGTFVYVQGLGTAQEPLPPLAPERTWTGQEPAQQPTSSPTPASMATPGPNQQQPANPPLSDPELWEREKQLEHEVELEKKEQSSRILGVLPEFSVTRQNAPPLTPRQKFRLFRKTAFDPFVFALVGAQAGISQARNTFPGYGQGAEGYGKRYGAAYADRFSAGLFSTSFAVLLKQDPRYFRLGEGSSKHRIGYALAQQFVCKTDEGNRQFNYSRVSGVLMSAGLSNAYYPESSRGFGFTMSRVGISVLYGSLIRVLEEFWPDIDKRFIQKKRKNPPTPSAPNNPPPN